MKLAPSERILLLEERGGARIQNRMLSLISATRDQRTLEALLAAKPDAEHLILPALEENLRTTDKIKRMAMVGTSLADIAESVLLSGECNYLKDVMYQLRLAGLEPSEIIAEAVEIHSIALDAREGQPNFDKLRCVVDALFAADYTTSQIISGLISNKVAPNAIAALLEGSYSKNTSP
ncbi:Uncharacterised protein [Candidatus Anstonella stagnisolia]|nr:Uncharacterised protein [Candidatus Anstonella stagnisolia]